MKNKEPKTNINVNIKYQIYKTNIQQIYKNKRKQTKHGL